MLGRRGVGRVALPTAVALGVAVLLALGTATASGRLVHGKAAVAFSPRAEPTPTPDAEELTLDMAVPVVPLPAGTPLPAAGTGAAPGALPGADTAPGAGAGGAPAGTTRAAVVVDTVEGRQADAMAVLDELDGVVHVSTIRIATVLLGGVQAEVAAVDPATFRAFTPEATADHQPLWDRLAAGDIAVTHEFGTTHDVELGTQLGLGPRSTAVRVGAFATNGTPPVADAIVGMSRASALGPAAHDRMLIGLSREASPTATVEALEAAGLVAEEIPDPRIPSSQTVIPPAGITPENVWDHLALCESSGNWHINTGNGYYGGIQFLPESWWAVGGTGLPHEHSREEQIYRGTLLWQIQGWEAWPQCARKLGLIVDQPAPPPPPPEDEGPSGPAAPGMQ